MTGRMKVSMGTKTRSRDRLRTSLISAGCEAGVTIWGEFVFGLMTMRACMHEERDRQADRPALAPRHREFVKTLRVALNLGGNCREVSFALDSVVLQMCMVRVVVVMKVRIRINSAHIHILHVQTNNLKSVSYTHLTLPTILLV